MVATATKNAAPAMVRSFVVGSRKKDQAGGFDSGNVTLTTAEQQLSTYQVTPSGFLRGIWVIVENTAVNVSTTTVAYNENGPFNVLSRVRVLDINSREQLGTFTGYDIYILNKYGGYINVGDAKAAATYSATTGTATTAGTFAFILCLPIEIIQRNALGSQLNKSGEAQFQVEWAVAGTGTVFSTAPTTSSTLRVRAALTSWLDPEKSDASGNAVQPAPPLINTTQFWHKQHYEDVDTERRLQGITDYVRTLVFISYRSASTRANGESDWPDPFSLKYENAFLIQSRNRLLYRQWIAQHYGYPAAVEASEGRDNGVYPIWEFIQDWTSKPGGENTREYLPCSSYTNLTVEGDWTNAADIDLLVNTVAFEPAGGHMKAAVP